MQMQAGTRKPRAGPFAGPQRSWMLRHSGATRFSKQTNWKSEMHNEVVSLVSCSDSETLRSWLLGGSQPRPGLGGHSTGWPLSIQSCFEIPEPQKGSLCSARSPVILYSTDRLYQGPDLNQNNAPETQPPDLWLPPHRGAQQ